VGTSEVAQILKGTLSLTNGRNVTNLTTESFSQILKRQIFSNSSSSKYYACTKF